jgi:hypothetical protein
MRGHQKDNVVEGQYDEALALCKGSPQSAQPGGRKKDLHGTKRQDPPAGQPRKQLTADKAGNEPAGGRQDEYPYDTDYNDHFETSGAALAHIEPVLYRSALFE